MKKYQFKQLIPALVLSLIAIAGVSLANDRTEPLAFPTNIDKPVHIGAVAQSKTGGLSVGDIFVAEMNALFNKQVFINGLVSGPDNGEDTVVTTVPFGSGSTTVNILATKDIETNDDFRAANLRNSKPIGEQPLCTDKDGTLVLCGDAGPERDVCANIEGIQSEFTNPPFARKLSLDGQRDTTRDTLDPGICLGPAAPASDACYNIPGVQLRDAIVAEGKYVIVERNGVSLCLQSEIQGIPVLVGNSTANNFSDSNFVDNIFDRDKYEFWSGALRIRFADIPTQNISFKWGYCGRDGKGESCVGLPKRIVDICRPNAICDFDTDKHENSYDGTNYVVIPANSSTSSFWKVFSDQWKWKPSLQGLVTCGKRDYIPFSFCISNDGSSQVPSGPFVLTKVYLYDVVDPGGYLKTVRQIGTVPVNIVY